MDLKLVLATISAFCISGVFASNKMIVVLIDGCRWDYINDKNLKGIPRIVEHGVRAEFVNPVYPSLSYPNYYSIVTGLYAENHGFVNNVMFENETDSSFLMLPKPNSTDAHWWNEAEPIWVTAEKNQKYTALYWWAGCEVEIKGIHPTVCERHRYGPGTEDEKLDFLERIDDVLQMFKSSRSYPSDSWSLALMYYGAVDYNGHVYGPDSPERKKALYDIDEILDKLLSKTQEADLENQVNVMVVSDHGMTDVSTDTTKYIDLEKFAPLIKYQASSGATSMLVPINGAEEKLYNDIKTANIEGLRIYKKKDIPEAYHIKNNKRVSPIFLDVPKGYFINSLVDEDKRLGGYKPPGYYKGHHGYAPNETKDMRSIFLATGPDFRKAFETKPLENVDMYNVMCHVLRIRPLPNNGSWDRVKSMLTGGSKEPIISSAVSSERHPFSFCITIIALFTCIFCFKSYTCVSMALT